MLPIHGVGRVETPRNDLKLPVQEIESIEAEQSAPIIDHFPLDKNLAYLIGSKIYDETYDIRKEASLAKILPEVPAERREFLHKFLGEKRVLHLKGNKRTITVCISIAELLGFIQGQSKIIGGYAKFIYGKKKFEEIAAELKLPDRKSRFFQKILDSFDNQKIDLDLQHTNPEHEREILYIKFVQFLARRSLPNNPTEEQVKTVYDELMRGGSFEKVGTFIISDKEIEINTVRIPLQFENSPPVDFMVGPKCRNAYIASPQDFWINPEEKIPGGHMRHGWKAILDSFCKIYQLKRHGGIIAWARGMLYNANMGRHPNKIPDEIHKSVKKTCKEEKKVASTLAHFITTMCQHKKGAEATLVVTYNACSDLSRKKFEPDDLKRFAQMMLQEIPFQDPSWRSIKQALMNVSFPVLSAFMELISVVKLSSKCNHDVYLTQHDGVPHVMFFKEEHTFLQALDPLDAMKRIHHHPLNQEALDLVTDLCTHFLGQESHKRDFESAIDRYQRHLNWDWESLTLAIIPFLHQLPLFSHLWTLCTGLTKIPEGKFNDILFDLLRRWTPLESINGCKLIDLHTKEFTESEFFHFAQDLLKTPVHPILALHLLKKITSNNEAQLLLKQVAACLNIRNPGDYLFTFLGLIKQINDTSERLKTICQAFLHTWIELSVEEHCDSGAHLFSLILTEQLLPINKETATLSLTLMLSAFAMSKEKAFDIWKRGEDYGFWVPDTFKRNHRTFMVEFAEYLYSQNDLEWDGIANNLIEMLPAGKDNLNSRIAALNSIRDARFQKILQSHDALKKSLASFEKALRDSATDQLREAADDLLKSLYIMRSSHKIHLSCLNDAKHLLSNPKVIDLFRSHPESYYDHVEKFLAKVDRMDRCGHLDQSLVFGFMEIYCREVAPYQTVYPPFLLSLWMRLLKVENHTGFRQEALKLSDVLFEALKSKNKLKETYEFLRWYSAATKEPPKEEYLVWILEETSRKKDTDPDLPEALDYLARMQNHYHSITFSNPDQIRSLMRFAVLFMNLNMPDKALFWMEKAVGQYIANAEVKGQDIEDELLRLSSTFFSEHKKLFKSLSEAIFKRNSEMHDLLYKHLNKLNESDLEDNARLYFHLLPNCGESNKDFEKINTVFKVVLKQELRTTGNLEACLNLIEGPLKSPNVHLEPILRVALDIKDSYLKLRALAIQMERVSQPVLNEDFVQSLIKTFNLLSQLPKHPDRNLFDYYRTINQHIFGITPSTTTLESPTDLNLLRNTPIRSIDGISPQQSREIVQTMLHSLVELLPEYANNTEQYLQIASHAVQILGNFDDLLPSEEIAYKYTYRIIQLFGESTISSVFEAGIVHLIDEIEGFEKKRHSSLTTLCIKYFDNVARFAENDKIPKTMTDKISKLSIAIYFKVDHENKKSLYESILKLYPLMNGPGDLLLPATILKNLSFLHLTWYIFKYCCVETPNFIFLAASIMAYWKGGLNFKDFLFWITTLMLWYTFIKQRYGQASAEDILTNRFPSVPQAIEDAMMLSLALNNSPDPQAKDQKKST